MARSIHTTRRSLAELKKRKFASDDDRRVAISKAEFKLQRKRRIKRHVSAERHAVEIQGEPVPGSAIPIVVADQERNVFHAASSDDIRMILGMLPAAAVEGIGEIRLSLGRDYMLELIEEYPGKPDPFTGRAGFSSFPGVYSGTVLGTYFPSKGLVCVYGYVVDWDHLAIPRAILETYLRLLTLKTLMHEIAHFHDRTARVGRGRWLADRRENLEWYAEKQEQEWTEHIVVPFLERTYAKEARAFRSWVKQRGGIDLPLTFFAGDSRRTERNGLTRLVFSTSGAFESWLKELPSCGSRHEAYLALAWELHIADQYEDCLKVLNRILNDDGDHIKARECRADTLVHLERLDEALADADDVIRRAPDENGAWESRCDVLEERKDWAGIMETCRRWMLVPHVSPGKRRECHRYRAVALCATGDVAATETSLAAYWATFRFKNPERAKQRMLFVRRAVYRRAGRPLADDPMRKWSVSANT
ncbi:hypothetical protein [Opitutus sp. ER46]|uniref:tetratricopeptide repeat protein n=1 Tax=Opitutus sp. ER46 TaxID=2161864 RepID=UPI000D324E10|nr:hypothetical protein [Opitutus sp. ER46]PTX94609.1 hypothetical protein DB354_12830 [Opitutus sp. ER46]